MRAWLKSAARSALGITPSCNEIAGALLKLSPREAKASVTRAATALLRAEISRVSAGASADRRPPTEVRASSIPNAGLGIHARFDARAMRRGDVVALYAGVFHPPAPPVDAGCDDAGVIIPQPAAGEDGRYLLNLEGGGYVDGATHARTLRELHDRGVCAGWATAALANHPPAGTMPNVEAVRVDWEDAGEETRRAARAIVNPMTTTPWYVDGGTGIEVGVPPSYPTSGVAFIATRDIDPGEEIFFNYRLGGTLKPSIMAWYTPVPWGTSWAIVDDAEETSDEEQRREREWRERRDRGDWDSGALG
jgi:hypothetical protein